MKHFIILLMLIVMVATPTIGLAQDPGAGGVIIEGESSDLANLGSLNPLRCSGTNCQTLYQLMFLPVINLDPETSDFAFGAEGGLAVDWAFNDDGTELTINLRDDVFWSDGEQVTSEDVKFTYEAIASGEIESDLTGTIDAIITAVDAVDDLTVVMHFAEADCTALSNATLERVIPAHTFGFDGDYENFDFSVMIDHITDDEPPVAAGPFVYGNTVTGQQVNLLANQSYADAPDGVIPTGYARVDAADQDVEIDRFLAGDFNYIEPGSLSRYQNIRESDNQFFDFPSNSYSYIGFNTGDPENPVNALDEDDNLVEQPPHPIFGDVRVRQALSYAVDKDALIDSVLDGEAVPIIGNELPTSWAVHPDLEPYGFDLDEADRLLTEAGWIDGDGDGVRECTGCLYAEEGTPMEFSLKTNEGNSQREDIGLVFQDQMRDLGVTVNFEPIDFNTLIDELLGQTFDAVIIGWSLSWPANPDTTQLFSAQADEVGAGFNFTSWINEEYIAANEAARTISGCNQDERNVFYHRMQEIQKDEAPYIFLYSPIDMYAAAPNLDGFNPFPNDSFWNVTSWSIQN